MNIAYEVHTMDIRYGHCIRLTERSSVEGKRKIHISRPIILGSPKFRRKKVPLRNGFLIETAKFVLYIGPLHKAPVNGPNNCSGNRSGRSKLWNWKGLRVYLK